jgi:tyrosyl-tRNA synthetase
MLPEITVPRTVSLVDIVITAGFAKSKSAARRLIEQGGIRINDVKVTDPNLIVQWPEKE